MDLFSSEIETSIKNYQLKDAAINYYDSFFSEKEANSFYSHFSNETDWQEDTITVFGKTYKQPRLTALYALNKKPYSYSGITMHPKPFTQELIKIKSKIETVIDVNFTTVLLNLYRDGNDSNGWHSDDEKELGKNPIIASVSFGATRQFKLQHKKDKALKEKIALTHGSLLIMSGTTQHYWKHQIPKTRKVVNPRINLTFRIIK
ncbi:alpha-ketoglutarate-dependent dioxygenase AlkB family protein [Patiriisocius hiemis]|uniref:Alpha-ketoglutarate-dependent dioxygenase AlkB n=1 Tax=Patiriisocius hiemis TaxID=3075604 RepID=A0ABU2YAW4_9FLAO|nr:alpha-ketoglutarate-dependent dioxygenase AlkB [Constantimarinum sp. W242]MDT0554380.1 alpha-ketoglutarate-dependent dioxygenase AlkB [Constantimarinum sp. W242]